SSFTNIKDTHNQYISIGSDVDWWHFAKGTNTNKDFRNIAKEYRLTSDIDFKGVVVKEGEIKQNYAKYGIDLDGNGTIDTDEYTSMIVGDRNSFTANFDGQGYTLKNINIDTTITGDYNPNNVGIFGLINGAEFKNINIDYMGGGIKNSDNSNVGGFAGNANGTFSNITLSNIGDISNNAKSIVFTGGFVGSINQGDFSNITLNNIGSIGDYLDIGGFAGRIYNGTFSNITLNNIGSIRGYNSVGGFVGQTYNGTFSNITLNNIGSITGAMGATAGGFVGQLHIDGIFSNITLNNIGIIGSYDAGGFVGTIQENGTFSNIVLDFKDTIMWGNEIGGFAGRINDGMFSNINMYFENVKSEGLTLYSFYGSKYKSIEIDSIKFYSKGTQATANDEVAIIEVNDSFNKSDLIIGNIKYDSKNNIFYSIESGKELVYKDTDDGKSIMYAKNADGTIGDENSNIIFNDKTNTFELKNNGNGGNNEDSNFIDKNKDGLNDVTLSGNDFSKEILDLILKDFYNEKIIIDLQKS
ncbi:hypothetical protein B6S12_10535, partial [Helicobacter valdiviensis]